MSYKKTQIFDSLVLHYDCLLPILLPFFLPRCKSSQFLAAMTCYSGSFCIVHMTCYFSFFWQVNDGYARSLGILSKKLKFVQVNPLINASKALKDIKQELERLRQKALSKVTSSGILGFSLFLPLKFCPSFPVFTISGFQPYHRDFLCYEKAWN